MSRACCAGPNEISNIKPAQRWTVLFYTLDCVVPHVGLCCSTRWTVLFHTLWGDAYTCAGKARPRVTSRSFVSFSVSEEKEVGYHIRDFCRLFRWWCARRSCQTCLSRPPLFEIVAFIIILIQWRENLPPIAVFVQENGIESCSGIESLGLCCSHVRLEKPRVDERSLLRKK